MQWLLYRSRPQFPQARFKCGFAGGYRKLIRVLLNTKQIGGRVVVVNSCHYEWVSKWVSDSNLPWTVLANCCQNFCLGLWLCLTLHIKQFQSSFKKNVLTCNRVNVTLRIWPDWYTTVMKLCLPFPLWQHVFIYNLLASLLAQYLYMFIIAKRAKQGKAIAVLNQATWVHSMNVCMTQYDTGAF